MTEARLLIVEDDADIAHMLKFFFTGKGFAVEVAPNGTEALEKTHKSLPHLIVLDIMLPDIDGYEVCRKLRSHTRTSHIPILFLTQKDELRDKLQGLELGADDYITKPFYIQELQLRVQNALLRAERESLTDPLTGLPGGKMIEDRLRQVLPKQNWAFLDVRINAYEPFQSLYGLVAGNEVLRGTARVIAQVVDEHEAAEDFLGHAGSGNFVIITEADRAGLIQQQIKERFAQEVEGHYNPAHRQQGYVDAPNEKGATERNPLMSLAVGIVTAGERIFTDIRDVAELAAEARRQDAVVNGKQSRTEY